MALGAASGSNRCQRGGSWNNNANNCAVSNRNNNPYNRNNNYGFRVCRSSSIIFSGGREIPVIPLKVFRTGFFLHETWFRQAQPPLCEFISQPCAGSIKAKGSRRFKADAFLSIYRRKVREFD